MSNNILLQNPRDFTVQIKHVTTNNIVGTGIVLSLDGKIVTCAHVIRDAGVDPDQAEGMEVGVYFPKRGNSEAEARRARVVVSFHQDEDDIALLQLLGGPVPRSPEQIAVCGAAERSRGHQFESYGYRKLEKYDAGWTTGIIQGPVEPPLERKVRADPVQLKATQINYGMSGAGVLDQERNLVVGIVSETWFPDKSLKDFDTGWAVDAGILDSEPFNLPVRDEPLPLREAPRQREYVTVEPKAQACDLRRALRNAPAALPDEEWVGRKELLDALSADWNNPNHFVTSLVGFGGEGKSSLVRKWLDLLLADPLQPQPDDLFWWDFQKIPSVDAFLGAALAYLGGEKLAWNARESGVRVNMINSLLQQSRRFLFVLDGLESVQHREGDEHGEVESPDLKRLLQSFCLPGHQSFCIITSRTRVVDLGNYTTHIHRDVSSLNLDDGRALLRKIGVIGSDEALDSIVGAWEGHALTLSLLGSYITERHGGDIAHANEILSPAWGETRYERVRLILQYYDGQLTDAERSFLKLFSVFRKPVKKRAFERVFRVETGANGVNRPILSLDDARFKGLLDRLSAYCMLRIDLFAAQYTIHPLIREYYYGKLTVEQRLSVHYQLKDFYLLEADISRGIREELGKILEVDLPQVGDGQWFWGGEVVEYDERLSLFEAVHHACQAGAYDEAYNIYYFGVHEENWTLVRQLGAYETDLWLLREFFEHANFEQDPQIEDMRIRARLINQVGFDYSALGKPLDAIRFFRRAVHSDRQVGDLSDAFYGATNQSEALIQVGDLHGVQLVLKEMKTLIRQMRRNSRPEEYDSQLFEIISLATAAWVAHLGGDQTHANRSFQKAETLQVKREPHVKHLYSNGGIWYATHLIAIGNLDYAEAITQYNLALCENVGFVHNITACQRLLGDIARIRQNYASAQEWYNAAIERLQGVGLRYELSNSLLSRARLWLTQGEHQQALDNLTWALDLCSESGYRLIEADVRVALSYWHRAWGNEGDARAQAKRALSIAQETSYHWARIDAEHVLTDLGDH